MSALTALAKAFCAYTENRFKGKVHSIERVRRPDLDGLEVRLVFHIPAEQGVDEMEVFRRINNVIEVVVEGEPNNVR